MPKRTNKKIEIIIYKGIVFRRYPESFNWSDAKYYRPNSVHIRKGVQALHREIWRDHFGDIPEGYEIHHGDGDPDNNDLDNLVCVTHQEHMEYHKIKSEEYQRKRREILDRIRPLAAEWHGTSEGIEWHRQHAKEVWRDKEYQTLVCEQCGKEYQTKSVSSSRFCSNNCKADYRRRSGVDNEIRQCLRCGIDFECNKYNATKFCGNVCAAKYRWENRKTKPK